MDPRVIPEESSLWERFGRKNRDHSFATDFGGPDTEYTYTPTVFCRDQIRPLFKDLESPNGFKQISANHQLNVCI